MGAHCTKAETNIPQHIVIERETIVDGDTIEEELKHWHIWSQTDIYDEVSSERLFKFMQHLLKIIIPENTLRDSDIVLTTDIDLTKVELHDSIHMEWPLIQEQVEDMTMFEDFETSADDVHIPLPRQLYEKLIRNIIEYYSTKPNIIHIQIPADCKLTIVGDIHGQLQDLLHIFKTNGLPSATNWYLFNGDLVDRGHCSIEVCAILFAYHAMYPGSIHLNRGNHEDVFMNSIHSFRREVYIKYDSAMFDIFNDLFDVLPLAHIINEAVFVVHGGLSEKNLNLQEINSIPRDMYHLHTPHDGTLDETMYWMQDLLWSDPQRPFGMKESRRGAGVLFGPDICALFLRLNHLSMIVRSHEVVREGFMWPYDYDEVTSCGRIQPDPPNFIPNDQGNLPERMLLTIFSCSNYCHDTNKGAYIVLTSTLDFQLINYSVPSSNTITKGLPVFRSIQDHKRHNLIELILMHQEKLRHAFESMDIHHTQYILKIEWAEILSKILQFQFDWFHLAPILTNVDENDRINYIHFLDSYQSMYQQQPNSNRVFDILYPFHKQFQIIFHFFDRMNTGEITFNEFHIGCIKLNQYLPSNEQWKDLKTLFHSIDIDGTGRINRNKFFESFRIVMNYEKYHGKL